MSFYKNPIFLDLDMQGSPRTEISEKLQNFTIQYLLPWFVRYFSLSWYNINRIALIELLFLAKTFDPILRYCMTVLRRRQLMMRAYCHAHQLNLCPQCSWNRRVRHWFPGRSYASAQIFAIEALRVFVVIAWKSMSPWPWSLLSWCFRTNGHSPILISSCFFIVFHFPNL